MWLATVTVHAAPGTATEFFAEPDQAEGSVILPKSRPFAPLPTDPRDLKIGFRKTSRAKVEADVGGYRSIYGWKGEVRGKSLVFHTGIEGNAYFTMRREGSRFPLESSDGLFGLYAEATRNNWFYQVRFTHISAHLSDGSPDVLRNIRFSREFLVLRAARQVRWVRPYIGLIYLVHTIPHDVDKVGGQAGFYAIPPIPWKLFHPYFGMDFRGRGGREGSTWNFAAGLTMSSSNSAPPIRFALSYLTGHELRGQFFDRKVRQFSGGLELEF